MGDFFDWVIVSGEVFLGEGGGSGGKDKILSWIKNKYCEYKENVEQCRVKLLFGGERMVLIGFSFLLFLRGKSLDFKWVEEEGNNVVGSGGVFVLVFFLVVFLLLVVLQQGMNMEL